MSAICLVRRCEARDEGEWVRLNLQFMDEVKRDSEYWSTLKTPTETELRRIFAEILALPESVPVFVAERNGPVVAYANTCASYSVWSGGRALTVDDLYVEAGHRGQGIGRAIMEHLVRFAEQSGYRRVQLHAEMGNLAAHRLYLDLGLEAEDMRFFLKRLKA